MAMKQTHSNLVFLRTVSLAVVSLIAPVAFGQGPPPAANAANAANAAEPAVKVERGAGGKKIYKITTEITIEGKIQKPEAFYVLQKSSINYEWTELKQDFVPKILDSVSKAPF
jgi:hypothetical protein